MRLGSPRSLVGLALVVRDVYKSVMRDGGIENSRAVSIDQDGTGRRLVRSFGCFFTYGFLEADFRMAESLEASVTLYTRW